MCNEPNFVYYLLHLFYVCGRTKYFINYLGVPWLVRKMMLSGSLTKVFKENADGTYALENRSTMKTLTWTFKLNENIQEIGFDGKKHDVILVEP